MKKNQKSNRKRVKVIVGKNENKLLPYVWINNEEKEVYLDVRLVGKGASVKIIGIFLGMGNKSVVFNTNVAHSAKNTKSLTVIRGVFKDRSSFSSDGMVRINKGAKGADGYFASKILLFDDAKGRSVPSLEIDENELKAGHASAVGRPDEEQTFYLRSRGLTEKEAESLIISGFFKPAIAMLSLNKQKNIEKQLNACLKYYTT